MPTFTGGTSSSAKTTFGVPTGSYPTTINVPGFHAPGLSPEEQTGPSTIPAYVQGDEWGPASDPNPDNIRSLQLQMIQAGLLKLVDVHLGIWDVTSAKAYSRVLAQANVTGVPAGTALDEYVQTSNALPAKAIDPNDMAAIGNQAAQAVLGRNFDKAQLAVFSAAFQAALAGSPTGGPQTAAGMGQLAQNIVTEKNPQEAAHVSMHNLARNAMSILAAPYSPSGGQ